jgi:hypothetical protein
MENLVADTIEIDLATLERVLKHGLDPGFHTLQGCVAEIGVSPEVLTAFARKLGGIDGIVGPSELGAASLASK